MTTWRPPAVGEPQSITITRAEARVLTGICHGLTNGQIARVTHRAEDTVKSQVKALLALAGADHRTHLAVLAVSGALHITVAPRHAPESA